MNPEILLDTIDRRLLNLLQGGFPLVPEPFRALGEELGMAEGEVLDRVRRLKEKGVIRNLGAIFDGPSLGYQSALVALKVAPERLDQGAAAVSRHRGVSHNYSRNHPYNLWFTLILPPGQDLRAEADLLGRAAGAEDLLFLPSLKVFKIKATFDMLGDSPRGPQGKKEERPPSPLSRKEVDVIRELQRELPLEGHPFLGMAQRLKMEEEGLLSLMADLAARGVLRRYGAVLHHRKAGFEANALGCWVVSPERVEEVGRIMASFGEVTHCYQRATYPHWPYSLFTMIHAPTREGCEAIVGEISRQTGIKDYLLLYSIKEYKKSRVRYFEG